MNHQQTAAQNQKQKAADSSSSSSIPIPRGGDALEQARTSRISEQLESSTRLYEFRDSYFYHRMMNGMIRRAIRVGYHPKIDQTIKEIQAKRTAAAATATASRVGEDPNENDVNIKPKNEVNRRRIIDDDSSSDEEDSVVVASSDDESDAPAKEKAASDVFNVEQEDAELDDLLLDGGFSGLNLDDKEADWFLADVSHIIDDEEGAVDHNDVPPKKQNDDDNDRQDGDYCHTEDQGHLMEDDDIMFELDL